MNTQFLYRFIKTDARNQPDALIVFVASRLFDAEEFDRVIRNDIDRNLAPDQILVVVRRTLFPDIVHAMQNSIKIATLRDRLPRGLPIQIAAFNEHGAECDRRLVSGRSEPLRIDFSDFQNRAMAWIFRKNSGFVESTPAYHFENPSGKHTHRFMRLSNMLVHGPEISFCAFCTLRYLPADAGVAYIDTPAMFGLVGAINEHFATLASTRHLLADNFHSYEGLRPPKYKFSRTQDAVVLISASSNGALARDLMREEPLLRALPEITESVVGPRFCSLRHADAVRASTTSVRQSAKS